MQNVKLGGIKYQFLSLWNDSTWDWTRVSRAIGKYSAHLSNQKEKRTSKQIRNYKNKKLEIKIRSNGYIIEIINMFLFQITSRFHICGLISWF